MLTMDQTGYCQDIQQPAASSANMQVCQGVQAMHSQPECLIHRDIKVRLDILQTNALADSDPAFALWALWSGYLTQPCCVHCIPDIPDYYTCCPSTQPCPALPSLLDHQHQFQSIPCLHRRQHCVLLSACHTLSAAPCSCHVNDFSLQQQVLAVSGLLQAISHTRSRGINCMCLCSPRMCC